MSSSGVSAVGEKTCSSTIGPAGLDRICANVWSLGDFRWKTTVVGSWRVGAGQVGEQRGRAVRVVDLDHAVEAELHVGGGQVVAVGELQPRLQLDRVLGRRGEGRRLGDVRLDVGAAVAGCSSGTGTTWFITAKEPLSYAPAGSSVVILSVVPMVSGAAAGAPAAAPTAAAVAAAAATAGRQDQRGRCDTCRGDQGAPSAVRTGSHPQNLDFQRRSAGARAPRRPPGPVVVNAYHPENLRQEPRCDPVTGS